MSKGAVTTTVEVEIYGSSYKVRGANDSEHLHQLAGFVDEKMREIATQTKTVDTTKIAILAALNIADELRSCRGLPGDDEPSELSDKVDELAGRLEGALES